MDNLVCINIYDLFLYYIYITQYYETCIQIYLRGELTIFCSDKNQYQYIFHCESYLNLCQSTLFVIRHLLINWRFNLYIKKKNESMVHYICIYKFI